MPADEVTHGTDVEASIPVRTGPRHAAPKKPLFTRFHMPAGKAIALAAMPTAVLMGMGFTPTLANAEDQPTSKSLTIDEYKECVAALEDADASASASPSPSASASTDDAKDDKDSEGSKDSGDEGSTTPSTGGSKDTSSGSGGSSSDSGSDEEAEPAPSASSAPAASAGKPTSSSGDTATAAPSATETEKKNVLETIGDAIGDLFDGGKSADETPAPAETPSASAGTGDDATPDPGTGSSDSGSSGSGSSGGSATGGSGAAEDSKDKDSKDSKDAGDTKDTVTEAVKDAAEDAADEATASPSASPSESADDVVDDCPVATLDESGVDNKTPIADDPWYLNASSLLLKGADYKGVVEVKTANGTKKKVLKYVISGGTDIGDLHQTVEDKQAGKTYHVQASSGSTSTIRDGDTIMYTQSISGNLFGLIPVTFDPENPPPLNIPLIYFTKVKVVQAAQMGGNLHIPGMHVYTD
ncbi:hypothetical protein ACWD64_09540 [Streptomyces antibioticus]